MKSPTSIKVLRRLALGTGLILTAVNPGFATTEKAACEFTQKYLAQDLSLKVECTDNYMHYCSGTMSCAESIRRSGAKAPTDLKIAGFNVYNLGMEADFTGKKLTPFKDVNLLAEIINQWDVVSAVELKHFDSKDFRFNQHITKFIEELEARGGSRPVYADKKALKEKKPAFTVTAKELKSYYRIPAYLQVLKALQKKDKSWALILSNTLHGKNIGDTLNNELTGVFYRKKNVDIIETEYCQDLACTSKTEEFSAEVARKPFWASFRIGKLDFTLGGVHFRFRPPQITVNYPAIEKRFKKAKKSEVFEADFKAIEVGIEQMAKEFKKPWEDAKKAVASFKKSESDKKKVLEKEKELYGAVLTDLAKAHKRKKALVLYDLYNPMLDVYNFTKATGYKWKTTKKAQAEKHEYNGRFSEVKNVTNLIGEIRESSKEKDIILFGDFNLPAPGKNERVPGREKDKAKWQALKEAWHSPSGVLENFEGAITVVNEKTTVGNKALNMKYDHFVFSKSGSLKGCSTSKSSAKAYNFTKRPNTKLDKIISRYDIDEFKASLAKELKTYSKGKNLFVRYTPGQINFLATGFQTKVLDSYAEKTFTVYRETISDHLPISMKCKTK